MKWVVVHKNRRVKVNVIQLTILDHSPGDGTAVAILDAFHQLHTAEDELVMGVMPEVIFDSLPEGAFLGRFY